jgi:hypothetical protein
MFIEPFTTTFIKLLQGLSASVTKRNWELAGFTDGHGIHDYDGHNLLAGAFAGVKVIARAPLQDKEYEKVAWLFDRMAKRLGVPLLKSYPRVRPGDVVE